MGSAYLPALGPLSSDMVTACWLPGMESSDVSVSVKDGTGLNLRT